MNDMRPAIVAKSDQLTADDLISGPRTITVTHVVITPESEQKVSVFFEGDDGKPYRSCKSMSRVMVHAWGPDAAVYPGRSMTLYRDPSVKWGGMAVGGIRISHISHIEKEQSIALMETAKKKKVFRVLPLGNAPPARTLGQFLDELETNLRAATDYAAVMALVEHPDTRRAQDKATNGAAQRLADMIEAATARVTADDDFPGVVTEAGV
jgi:hypothetical protein